MSDVPSLACSRKRDPGLLFPLEQIRSCLKDPDCVVTLSQVHIDLTQSIVVAGAATSVDNSS